MSFVGSRKLAAGSRESFPTSSMGSTQTGCWGRVSFSYLLWGEQARAGEKGRHFTINTIALLCCMYAWLGVFLCARGTAHRLWGCYPGPCRLPSLDKRSCTHTHTHKHTNAHAAVKRMDSIVEKPPSPVPAHGGVSSDGRASGAASSGRASPTAPPSPLMRSSSRLLQRGVSRDGVSSRISGAGDSGRATPTATSPTLLRSSSRKLRALEGPDVRGSAGSLMVCWCLCALACWRVGGVGSPAQRPRTLAPPPSCTLVWVRGRV